MSPGAQSSLIPALDAALGLQCGAGVEGDDQAAALVPYLLKMRHYMPPSHRHTIETWEEESSGIQNSLRNYATGEGGRVAEAFDEVLQRLWEFRTLHLELAHRFVRQW